MGRTESTSGWRLLASTAVLVAAVGGTGCSPVMAAHQPGRRNVDLLTQGMPRNLVIAELGAPIQSETKDGKRVEVFSFTQGYRKGVKVGRTIGHATGDVLTLGLWEIAGTPTEAALNGHQVAYEVTYDGSDRIERVVPLKQ